MDTGVDVGMDVQMDGHTDDHRHMWTDERRDGRVDGRVGGCTGGWRHTRRDARTDTRTHGQTRTGTRTGARTDGERRKKEAEIRAGAAETHPHPRAPRRRRKEEEKEEEGGQLLPGILRLRSQVLPMVAMEGACRRRVMLSFMRPSPVTFTVKGLPVGDGHLRDLVTKEGPRGPGAPVPPHVSPSPPVPTWDMFVGKLDVDDVVAGLSGAVGDLAGAVLHILTVDVHLAGTLDGQAQPTVAWAAMRTCSELSHCCCPHPGHAYAMATIPTWPRPCHNHGHHSTTLSAMAAPWPRPPSLPCHGHNHGHQPSHHHGHYPILCWPQLWHGLGHHPIQALAMPPPQPPSNPSHSDHPTLAIGMATTAPQPQPRPPSHPCCAGHSHDMVLATISSWSWPWSPSHLSHDHSHHPILAIAMVTTSSQP